MTKVKHSKAQQNINWLKKIPIAHRGLHDKTQGVYENSLSAVQAAIDGGYSIEVDLQPSSDQIPMVFHDADLKRMTTRDDKIRDVNQLTLNKINLLSSDDTIPTLQQLFDLVDGRSGLVLEMKGHEGPVEGFVPAILDAISKYDGPVVIMSFDHWLLEEARDLAPDFPIGLTAYGDDNRYEINRQAAEDYGVDFVSYELANLDCKFVSEFKKTGKPVISWTVRTRKDLERSNKYADQPTFEGFRP